MTTPDEKPDGAADAPVFEPEPAVDSVLDPAPVEPPVAATEPVVPDAPVFPATPAAPTPTPYAAPPAPPQAYAAPNAMPHTWMNITAFVTGILGLGIVPVIFGHLGVNRSNRGTADFKWMGIVGLVLGYLTLVAYLVLTAVLVGAIIANNN